MGIFYDVANIIDPKYIPITCRFAVIELDQAEPFDRAMLGNEPKELNTSPGIQANIR